MTKLATSTTTTISQPKECILFLYLRLYWIYTRPFGWRKKKSNFYAKFQQKQTMCLHFFFSHNFVHGKCAFNFAQTYDSALIEPFVMFVCAHRTERNRIFRVNYDYHYTAFSEVAYGFSFYYYSTGSRARPQCVHNQAYFAVIPLSVRFPFSTPPGMLISFRNLQFEFSVERW